MNIAVIACCATKDKTAATFTHDGKRVVFVAHPNEVTQSSTELAARPDDPIPGEARTWRDRVEAINAGNEDGPLLKKAADLYTPKGEFRDIYRRLTSTLGCDKTFILSAGWGLVAADYRIPTYDITFNKGAGPGRIRSFRRDVFKDFQQLTGAAPGENLYFFGGKDYRNPSAP